MLGRVVAIFGPTAVGKTAFAVAFAERHQAARPVAVSADAMQVYRGLEALTGAPSAAERARLEHRLVAFLGVDRSFDVAQYMRLAHAEIDGLLAAGRMPIVTGGTGLYLRAALTDLTLRPPPPPGVRERWQAELERLGPHALHGVLAGRAAAAAAGVAAGDGRRIVRLLELDEIRALAPPGGRNELWTAATRHPTRLIGLTMDRERLNARIDERVERMIAAGAAAEVAAAVAAGASPTARQAIGFAALQSGDVEELKRQTRRYAKRQLTWMRKLAGVELVDVTDRSPDEVAAALR